MKRFFTFFKVCCLRARNPKLIPKPNYEETEIAITIETEEGMEKLERKSVLDYVLSSDWSYDDISK